MGLLYNGSVMVELRQHKGNRPFLKTAPNEVIFARKLALKKPCVQPIQASFLDAFSCKVLIIPWFLKGA